MPANKPDFRRKYSSLFTTVRDGLVYGLVYIVHLTLGDLFRLRVEPKPDELVVLVRDNQ